MSHNEPLFGKVPERVAIAILFQPLPIWLLDQNDHANDWTEPNVDSVQHRESSEA